VSVGSLLAILRLLTGRAAAVGTGDVLLLLGLGLHLAIVRLLVTATSKRDAVFKDMLKIVHYFNFLVVEQAHACKRHGDAVFVAGLYHIVVAYGATGLSDKLHTTLVGTLDIVAKGEEGIRP